MRVMARERDVERKREGVKKKDTRRKRVMRSISLFVIVMLEDGQALQDYNIQNEETLYIIVCMHGI
jgi:hypothetical protein